MQTIYIKTDFGTETEPQIYMQLAAQINTFSEVVNNTYLKDHYTYAVRLPHLPEEAQYLTREEFDTYLIPADCNIVIEIVPQGGGGFGNIVRIAAFIAVAVGASYLAPVLGASLGLAEGGFGISLLAAGLTAVGGLAINALFPIDLPAQGAFGQGSGGEASPTYGFTNRSNTVREGQAVPVLYGRHLVIPDLISGSYNRYIDNDQFHYRALLLTQGEMEIEQVFIGEDPADNFVDDINYVLFNEGEEIPSRKSFQETGERITFDPRPALLSYEMTGFTKTASGSYVAFEDRRISDDSMLLQFSCYQRYASGYSESQQHYIHGVGRTTITVDFTFRITLADGTVRNVPHTITETQPEVRGIISLGNVSRGRRFTFGTDGVFGAILLEPILQEAGEITKLEILWDYSETIASGNGLDFQARTRFDLLYLNINEVEATQLGVYNNPVISNYELSDEFSPYYSPTPTGVEVDATFYELDFVAPTLREITSGSSRSIDREIIINYQGRNASGFTDRRERRVVIKGNGEKPARITVSIMFPNHPERIVSTEVRVRRAEPASTDPAIVDDIFWTGLRARGRGNPQQAIDSTRMTAILRASGTINSNTANQLGVVGTRILKVYAEDGTYTKQKTANPMWAAVDLITNTDYGLGPDISDINMSSVIEIATQLDTEGVEFNYYFDNVSRAQDALKTILRPARTTHFFVKGKFDFVRDSLDNTPTAIIPVLDIVENSYQQNISLAVDGNQDGVVVEYIDDSLFWKPNTYTYPEDSRNPQSTAVRGLTATNKAQQIAAYLYNKDQYSRTILSITLRRKGLLLCRGDDILIQGLDNMEFIYNITGIAPVEDSQDIIITLESPPVIGDNVDAIMFSLTTGGLSDPIRFVHSGDDDDSTITITPNDEQREALLNENQVPVRLVLVDRNDPLSTVESFKVLETATSANGNVSVNLERNDTRIFNTNNQ